MSEPWIKFYPRDWRGDQALRAVSIAARGLWMECLCIMHEASPRGHLVLNGNPVEDDTLARMAGVSVDEVLRLMAELRQAGVLSVTRKGVVFSRRMTKDHARAQKGKVAVQKRWNKAKSDCPQASDTKQKSDAPNRLPNRDPITQKPEARSQILKEEPKGSLSSGDDDPPPRATDEVRSAFDAYNLAAEASGWPRAQVLSKTRRSGIAARLRECGGIAGWAAALAKAQASPLCCGQNDRGWLADLDFIIQPKSFTRLMEGAYDNRAATRKSQQSAGGQRRADPALEQIARLTGLSEAPGYGRC